MERITKNRLSLLKNSTQVLTKENKNSTQVLTKENKKSTQVN